MRRNLLCLLAALAVVTTHPLAASGEITAVDVGIRGGLSPNAATALRQALSALEGVERVEVNTALGRATITPAPGWKLSARKLGQTVREAGMNPTWVRFEAVGQLTAQHGRPGFRVQGTDQLILLATDGKFDELTRAARRDCDLILITATIPADQDEAHVERFRLTGLSGPQC
jgi:hypothetical protein